MPQPFVPMTLSLFALATAFLPLVSRAQNAAPLGSDKPLASYRDKNRVLAVFAPTSQDPAYQEQMKLWQGEKAGFDDRQLVVAPFFANAKKPAAEEQAQVQSLMKKHGIDANGFAVVLIGKDGHDAFHAARPVPAATLYGIIDAMPMRRAETKRPTPASPTPVPTPRRPDVDHDE